MDVRKQEWIEKIKAFVLKKDNLLICVLTGILLLVIAWPVKSKEETNNNKNMSGLWNPTGKSVESDSKYIVLQENSNLKEPQLTEYYQEEGESSFSREREITYSLEQRLEEILSDIDGVGKVKVMVTLASSGEKIIEKDAPVNRSNIIENDSAGGNRTTNEMNTTETTIYITNAAGDKIPYVVKEISPEIAGVSVVARGGGNPLVEKNITEVIQALFGLETHKIKVVKMKQQE